MKIEKIKISEITPYAKNVKRHSEQQIGKIAKSIKEVWFIQPLVVDEKNVILIGHWRFEALRSLWEKEADCVKLTWLTEAQKKALRIRDNKLNESEFDISNLRDELQALFDEWADLEDLWFSLKELEWFDLKIEEVEPISNEVDNLVGDENWWQNFDDIVWNNEATWPQQAYDFSSIKWNVQQKQPLTFYLNDAERMKAGEFFATSHKREANVPLLMEVLDFYLENHK